MKKRPRGGALIPAGGYQQAEEVPEDEAKTGDYIKAGSMGLGDLDDAHTDGRAPDELRGRLDGIDTADITVDWVLRRLVAEANDFGTRTRQSGRLKALEMIGNHLSMFDRKDGDDGEGDDDISKMMTREERITRAQVLLEKAQRAGVLKKDGTNGR